MSHTDMGIVGATTDTFILFENGVRRNRLVLPGLSNAADHMPSKPDPPTACAYRKSSPSILVMQSTQDRTAHNASRCLGGT
jgi:hypothetical protein